MGWTNRMMIRMLLTRVYIAFLCAQSLSIQRLCFSWGRGGSRETFVIGQSVPSFGRANMLQARPNYVAQQTKITKASSLDRRDVPACAVTY